MLQQRVTSSNPSEDFQVSAAYQASHEEYRRGTGADDDLQTILRVLESTPVGFKRQEDADGPFANMDTAMLTGLNIRVLSVIKGAQQQQQQHQRRFPSH
ncbi:TPA: hypothetical protein ACH3X3_000831 [Trebouxia sp. C0006]